MKDDQRGICTQCDTTWSQGWQTMTKRDTVWATIRLVWVRLGWRERDGGGSSVMLSKGMDTRWLSTSSMGLAWRRIGEGPDSLWRYMLYDKEGHDHEEMCCGYGYGSYFIVFLSCYIILGVPHMKSVHIQNKLTVVLAFINIHYWFHFWLHYCMLLLNVSPSDSKQPQYFHCCVFNVCPVLWHAQ